MLDEDALTLGDPVTSLGGLGMRFLSVSNVLVVCCVVFGRGGVEPPLQRGPSDKGGMTVLLITGLTA
jgi:hypothetical protein